MKLELTADWAGFKKGETVIIVDQSVIDKGYEVGLFKTEKKAESIEVVNPENVTVTVKAKK